MFRKTQQDLNGKTSLEKFCRDRQTLYPYISATAVGKEKKTFYGIRPFRIITGSEDNTVAFYEGPPFKFKGLRSVRLFKFLMNFFRLVTIFQTSLAEKLFTELSLGNQQIRVWWLVNDVNTSNSSVPTLIKRKIVVSQWNYGALSFRQRAIASTNHFVNLK